MRALFNRLMGGLGALVMISAITAAASPAISAPPYSRLAQGTSRTPSTTAVATPSDFSGIWMNDNTLDERMRREGRVRQTAAELREPPPAAERPLTPEYEAIYQRMQADRARLAEGTQVCKWQGMPGIMTYPYPFEVLHTSGRITLLFEADSQVRRIFLDRQTHLPADELDPTYYGDSIGRWEGDTLVVDTVGFNNDFTIRGLPHSDAMKVVERIRFIAEDTIEDEITITDAKAFTRPIVMRIAYSRRPGWRIREYSCNENNRDAPDSQGQRSGAVVKEE